MLDASCVLDDPAIVERLAGLNIRLIIEAIEWDDRLATLTGHAALQVQGHEAGGRVGEEISFVLLQKGNPPLTTALRHRGG